jgi:hypothetical protein
VFAGLVPLIAADVLCVLLIFAVPGIALWLPAMAR